MSKILIKKGNVTVTIYATKNDTYTEFKVADYSTGKRRFHSFHDEDDARKKAAEIASALARGEADVISLRSADKAAYSRSLSLLKPLGIPLEIAALHFSKAVKALGSDMVVEAARDYARRNPSSRPRKKVEEVLAEMLDAKAKDGASEVYLRTLRIRLGTFSKNFQCRISDVTTQLINDYLRDLSGSPRTRNNCRTDIRTLFSFAEACGYVTRGSVDFDCVARAKEPHTAIEVYTPQEIAKLLEAARTERSDMLAFLALGAFAGLRTAEIQRQLWQDINLERGFIRVTAAKGNTAQKRLVPISQNLKQWLALCWRDEGTCCDHKILERPTLNVSKHAGVKWKRNALRHSFISYRVAQTQNIPQVSLEAGNSVQIVNRNYRELVTPEEASEWFSVVPHAPANVVPLAAASA